MRRRWVWWRRSVTKGLPRCAPRSTVDATLPEAAGEALTAARQGGRSTRSKAGRNRQESAGATQGRSQQPPSVSHSRGWADERTELCSHGRCDAVQIGAAFRRLARAWCRARSQPAASSASAASAAPVTSGCVSCWCWAPPPSFALPSRGAPAHRHGCSHLLERKPRKLAAVALANKMARIIWAMLTRGEDYRSAKPVVA